MLKGILGKVAKIYEGKWKVSEGPRLFTKEELTVMEETATVVAGDYQNSVEFVITADMGGGTFYIPLDKKDPCPVGAILQVDQIFVLTLSRSGNEDILRIRTEFCPSDDVQTGYVEV